MGASRHTHDEACARVATLFPQRWLRHYVASKLRSDPVFQLAHELLRESREPLFDVGCGVGLLPFYLRERGFAQPITGFDADRRKIEQARAITKYDDVEFIEHDLCHELPPISGNIALLDVLHYLKPARQRALLPELAACVPIHDVLLLRDAPRDGSVRFCMTYAGELFAQAISWNMGAPLHFATREEINAPLPERDFTRAEQPAWGGTPFNNRLFTFRRRASAAAPAQG